MERLLIASRGEGEEAREEEVDDGASGDQGQQLEEKQQPAPGQHDDDEGNVGLTTRFKAPVLPARLQVGRRACVGGWVRRRLLAAGVWQESAPALASCKISCCSRSIGMRAGEREGQGEGEGSVRTQLLFRSHMPFCC